MIDRRVALGGVLITCALIAGCSSGDEGITLGDARKAAAGESPTSCPIPFDVSAALPGSPKAQPGEVEVQTSKTTTPAPDPVAAQRDQGMSALDAAAGVSISCDYDVEGKTVEVWLVVTPGRGAVNMMAPSIMQAAKMDTAQLRDFLTDAPEPGEVKLTPGGDVAVAGVQVQDDGDASLLVNPDGIVTDDVLSTTTETLLSQIKF